MRTIAYLLLPFILISCSPDKKEQQNSFATEHKSHQYYVEQAGLWWNFLQSHLNDEMAWYNYYRSCRNAQGTADWNESFVNEAEFLRLGKDIVVLMEKHIPNSFVFLYVKGSTGAVDYSEGNALLKAYDLNPDFEPIQGAMVTYAESTQQPKKRKEYNEHWYSLDEMHPGLLQFSKNLLSYLDSNAILLTQHDNDTYPTWMVQDVLNFRPDITVINIDFLLLSDYRALIFNQLEIPAHELPEIHVNDYRENWTNVVQHILKNYRLSTPLYVSKTVSAEWYKGYESKLTSVGMVYELNRPTEFTVEDLANLEHTHWNLKETFNQKPEYTRQYNLNQMNQLYLPLLKELKRYYSSTNQNAKQNEINGYINQIKNKQE